MFSAIVGPFSISIDAILNKLYSMSAFNAQEFIANKKLLDLEWRFSSTCG
jgi:hypothetical protein